MRARVHVRLKDEVLDPQGKAILAALHQLGFGEVSDVRAGKLFEIELEAEDPGAARRRVAEMAEKLLANTVIESFDCELEEPR